LEEKSDLGVKEKDEQRKNIEGRIPLIQGILRDLGL